MTTALLDGLHERASVLPHDCEPVVYTGHQTLSPVFVPRHLHDELTQRDRIQAALNRNTTGA